MIKSLKPIFNINFFVSSSYSDTRCLKIHQLNIIKKPRKVSKKAREWYQNLFEEEKNKKRNYGRKGYKNPPEHEKQRLIKYRKNIIKYGKIKPLHK